MVVPVNHQYGLYRGSTKFGIAVQALWLIPYQSHDFCGVLS